MTEESELKDLDRQTPSRPAGDDDVEDWEIKHGPGSKKQKVGRGESVSFSQAKNMNDETYTRMVEALTRVFSDKMEDLETKKKVSMNQCSQKT